MGIKTQITIALRGAGSIKTTDYSGLKALAEAANIDVSAAIDTDGPGNRCALAEFTADHPGMLLALIAENERLRESPNMRAVRSLRGDCADLMAERDHLKAENEALRKWKERYEWLRTGRNEKMTQDLSWSWDQIDKAIEQSKCP